MAQKQERPGQLALELHCEKYQVESASFTSRSGGEGGLFSCSIAPVTDETFAALDRAARAQTPVSLWFSDCPVLLDLVTLERKAPQSVRIVGYVLRPHAKSMG